MSYFAVILASGEAKRLQKENEVLVLKPFLEINNTPLIVHIISAILKTNVKKLLITINNSYTQYHLDVISNFIDKRVEYEFIIVNLKNPKGGAKSLESIFYTNKLEENQNILVFFADTPFVQSETINNIIKKLNKNIEGLVCSFVETENIYKNWKLLLDNNEKPMEIIESRFYSDEFTKDIKLCCDYIFASKAYVLTKLLPLINECERSGEYDLSKIIKIAYNLKYNFIHFPVKEWETIGCNSFEELKLAQEFYQKNLIDKNHEIFFKK